MSKISVTSRDFPVTPPTLFSAYQIVRNSPRTHDCNLLLTPPQRLFIANSSKTCLESSLFSPTASENDRHANSRMLQHHYIKMSEWRNPMDWSLKSIIQKFSTAVLKPSLLIANGSQQICIFYESSRNRKNCLALQPWTRPQMHTRRLMTHATMWLRS